MVDLCAVGSAWGVVVEVGAAVGAAEESGVLGVGYGLCSDPPPLSCAGPAGGDRSHLFSKGCSLSISLSARSRSAIRFRYTFRSNISARFSREERT